MSSSSTVTFKVAGNDVISYMDKMKQKADQLTSDMIGNAKRQSDAAKDQLKTLEDQLKAIERKNRIESEAARRNVTTQRDDKIKSIEANYGGNPEVASAKINIANSNAKDQLQAIREQERQAALQTKLMRDNIETIKMTSNAEVIQMRKGDDGIIDELDKDASPMERLTRDLAEQKYTEEQERQHKDKKEERPESTMGGFLKAMALERGLGLASQMPSAKNELDFVKPMMSMIGMGIGGLMGNLMDAANIKILGTGLGNTSFGALGTQLGEKAGEFFGQAMERSYKGRDELTSSNFRLQALTGRNLQVDGFGNANGLGGTGISKVMANLQEYGLDFKEASEMQYKIAQAKGTSVGMGRDSENMVAVERAMAVSQETSTALMEMRRNYSQDFMKLVGGIAQKGAGNIFAGGDRTFLNEFIGKNFISLQRELLKQGANNVSSGATFDILRRFNDVGGPFAARDYRSSGLISQINGSLVNPNSDQTKAMSFLALRGANPGMGIADLMVEREKGLSSPTYMKNMMQQIDRMGGDDQFKRMNLAGMFGISNTAAQKLWQNRSSIMDGSISQEELAGTGAYGEEGIRETGRSQTSRYSKSTAEIQNAFIQDVAGGIKMVGSKMTELFGDMITELKSYINGQFSGSTEQPQKVRSNKVLTDKQKREAEDTDVLRNSGLIH